MKAVPWIFGLAGCGTPSLVTRSTRRLAHGQSLVHGFPGNGEAFGGFVHLRWSPLIQSRQ